MTCLGIPDDFGSLLTKTHRIHTSLLCLVTLFWDVLRCFDGYLVANYPRLVGSWLLVNYDKNMGFLWMRVNPLKKMGVNYITHLRAVGWATKYGSKLGTPIIGWCMMVPKMEIPICGFCGPVRSLKFWPTLSHDRTFSVVTAPFIYPLVNIQKANWKMAQSK